MNEKSFRSSDDDDVDTITRAVLYFYIRKSPEMVDKQLAMENNKILVREVNYGTYRGKKLVGYLAEPKEGR